MVICILLASLLYITTATTAGLNSDGQLASIGLSTAKKLQSLPANYTFDKTSEMQYQVGIVLTSPDQKWIIYTRNQDSSGPKNRIYFKEINSSSNPSYYTFGTNQSEGLLYCRECIKFSKKGDFMFLGTNRGMLYLCNFPSLMSSSSCDTKIDIKPNDYDYRGTTLIDVNGLNEVAYVWQSEQNSTVSVVELKEGGFTIKDNYTSPYETGCNSIRWHPVDMQVLVWLITSYYGDSFFYTINTTSKKNSTLDIDDDRLDISALQMFKDGQIALVSTNQKGLYAFRYSQGNLSAIGNIYETNYSLIHISQDDQLLIAYSTQKNTVQLLSVTTTTILNPNQPIEAVQVYLKLISKAPSINNLLFSYPDNNQILTTLQDPRTIVTYRLCPHQTYLSGLDCHSCSLNCSDCRFTQTTCLTCTNNSYILQDSICYPCFKYISNCSTCQNQSTCLSCTDFYYLSQTKCKPCDPYVACKSCTSESSCKICDDTKGYEETPTINSTCQCRGNFSFFDHKCINCSIFGCLFCEQEMKCKTCDESKGYVGSSEDGVCKCQASYSEVDGKCIKCDMTGCLRCQQANKCVSCSEDAYDMGPDGGCIEKQKNSFNIYVLIGSSIGGVFLIITIVVLCCKCKKRSNNEVSLIESSQFGENESIQYQDRQVGESVIRQSVYRRTIEQRVSQSIIEERIRQPLLGGQKEKVKYSDEQKIRLRRLQNLSLISN